MLELAPPAESSRAAFLAHALAHAQSSFARSRPSARAAPSPRRARRRRRCRSRRRRRPRPAAADEAARARAVRTAAQREKDEHCKGELRVFLRAVLSEIRKDPKNGVFQRAVDPEEAPDYYELIDEPMDLDTVRARIDAKEYLSLRSFVRDLERIARNAEAYNPQGYKDTRGRAIVHTAYNMLDTVQSMIHRFRRRLGYDLIGQCERIEQREIAARRARGERRGRRRGAATRAPAAVVVDTNAAVEEPTSRPTASPPRRRRRRRRARGQRARGRDGRAAATAPWPKRARAA